MAYAPHVSSPLSIPKGITQLTGLSVLALGNNKLTGLDCQRP